eukprot:gene19726-23463_t
MKTIPKTEPVTERDQENLIKSKNINEKIKSKIETAVRSKKINPPKFATLANMNTSYRKIVVKIGSNVLTRENGLPDTSRIEHLVEQLSAIKKQGIEVIVVSSGAVASGRSLIKIQEKQDAVAARQLLASIGQIKLIHTYMQLFEKQELLCSQVLVTKEDFRDRMHYLNIKNCLEILLQHH